MYKIFRKFAKKNINEFRRELARAHLIIAMLSIGLITFLALGSSQSVTYDPVMSAICVVLLAIVTIMSLCTAVSLFKFKK